MGPPQGTFAGAQLGASQLARAGASLVRAPRARMTGGMLLLERTCAAPVRPSVREPARVPRAPRRARVRARRLCGWSAPPGERALGARSGGAAAVDGAPPSSVLGWRRSTSTINGRFLCYSFGMGECNDLGPAVNVWNRYVPVIGGAEMPLPSLVLFFLHGYVYRIFTLN